MGKEGATEVLRWMHLAMGTDAHFVFSDQEPVSLFSVLEKLQQLKAESDNNRARADRYKKQLKDERARRKNESEDVKERLNERQTEIDGCRAESKSQIESLQETLQVERAKVSQLEKELEVSRVEVARYKSGLECEKKSRSEVRVDAIDSSTKMDNLTEMMERVEADCLNMRRTTSSNATIRARFTNIFNLSRDVLSRAVSVGGIDWSICVGTHVEHGVKYLSVYLQLTERNIPPDWSCTVHNQIRIFSSVSTTSFGTGQFDTTTFTDLRRKWGFQKIAPLQFLPDGKFMLEDSVIIAIDLFVFPTSTMTVY